MTYLTQGNVAYYLTRPSPKLLIHSGTHGDEAGVIPFVEQAVEEYVQLLPDLVFVPRVSPSAVMLDTRVNAEGADINRVFFSDSELTEVQDNLKIIEKYTFDLMVSFHEDPEFECYYLYDSSNTNEPTDFVLDHNTFLSSQGIQLLNGLDDPSDENLGYMFVNGYKKFCHDSRTKDNGMINVWLLNHGFARHTLLPEIPGNLSDTKKKLIIDSFFEKVLVPYFHM